MAYRNPRSTRPEAALDSAGPRFGEYPIRLLTRRTYSLWADDVINRRESAPNAVWIDPRSQPDDPAVQRD